MNFSSIKSTLFYAFFSILTAGFSASCVSTKDIALSAADRSLMQGKTFVVTTREKPHHQVIKPSTIAATTLGGAIGGAIAGTIAEKEGKAEIEKHQIANPNDMMSRGVAKALVAKTGAKEVPNKAGTKSFQPTEVAEENSNPKADYILDCFTTSWMGTYYPMSFSKYFIMFGAKMQLIETSTGRVVAEGFSLYQDKDREQAPDYDGIYSNGAAYLKRETKKGTDAATGKFGGLL